MSVREPKVAISLAAEQLQWFDNGFLGSLGVSLGDVGRLIHVDRLGAFTLVVIIASPTGMRLLAFLAESGSHLCLPRLLYEARFFHLAMPREWDHATDSTLHGILAQNCPLGYSSVASNFVRQKLEGDKRCSRVSSAL